MTKQRMLTAVPLTDDERVAIDDGQAVTEGRAMRRCAVERS
jgi:hypothetical protein